MKYRIEIQESLPEEIVILAREETPILHRLEELLKEEKVQLMGYRGDDMMPLSLEDIDCVFVQDGKVYVLTSAEKLQVKLRLYQLAPILGDAFVKINQSCLVRVSKIKRFVPSIGGALMVVLENGYQDYISRRQLKTIKERFGL